MNLSYCSEQYKKITIGCIFPWRLSDSVTSK